MARQPGGRVSLCLQSRTRPFLQYLLNVSQAHFLSNVYTTCNPSVCLNCNWPVVWRTRHVTGVPPVELACRMTDPKCHTGVPPVELACRMTDPTCHTGVPPVELACRMTDPTCHTGVSPLERCEEPERWILPSCELRGLPNVAVKPPYVAH
jgi:hypothetical protein